MTSRARRRVTAIAALALAATTLTACGAGDHDGDRSGTVVPGPNLPAPDLPRDDAYATPPPPTVDGLTDPAADPLSTFALDIDTGSYTRFRDAVNQGNRLSSSEIRTEEFVNYFDQDYAPPAEGVDVSIDAATLPFSPDHRIVRVGIRSADVADVERPDTDLVLVVDCSGSMSEYGKMETTKGALRTLVDHLRPTDRIAMVCYSSRAAIALEPTLASHRQAIARAIDDLRPQDTTNAAEGLELGYDIASWMRTEGRMARVVLVSDGVANVGETTPGGILDRIGDEARAGVNLVSVGVGLGTYGDALLEQLADRGDGWHVYVDTAREADRVFATRLTGSLVVTARDAKAQVQFDPQQVSGYRLIGYENRLVADEDFRDDTVDGGEVFAGHASTALYEVRLREGATTTAPFVTATVRYRAEDGRPVERLRELTGADCAPDLSLAPPRLRQDLVLAMLTDHLAGGPWSGAVTGEYLRAEASTLVASLDGDPDVAELADLVRRATA